MVEASLVFSRQSMSLRTAAAAAAVSAAPPSASELSRKYARGSEDDQVPGLLPLFQHTVDQASVGWAMAHGGLGQWRLLSHGHGLAAELVCSTYSMPSRLLQRRRRRPPPPRTSSSSTSEHDMLDDLVEDLDLRNRLRRGIGA